ncbi:MAG TPA: hypothetical protein VFG42_26155 [Baekduia sp.]|uniref:COG1470 family protein n=1 Tax=Baekduia sp. TaxID=2600305 RepID=UPI002D767EE6|nr:hypothetical protein [Baekduia sp.]HET6510304.1 hypothetical protein [Baekduia sp.]
MIITLHPTRLRAALPALGALWLLGAIARPAVAAAAGDGARWTVETAANRFGADRKDFGYTLSPGGSVRDALVIANQGDATLRLAVRPAAGVLTPAGRIALVDRGAGAAGIAAWVRPARAVVSVAPGASVAVPFTVSPPRGAAAGDHVGGIVATPVGTAAGSGAARRGVRIRLRVSGPLKPRLAVGDVHVRYGGTASPLGRGEATVSYTIRNTGNAILTARQAVSASGPFGTWSRHAGRVADSPPLLPGSTWKASASLRDVAPALRLRATVTLTPLLADAAGSIAPLPATKAAGHAWAVPWTLLLVVVVVLGLGAVALRSGLRRRRRQAGAAAPPRVDGAVA